VSSDPGQLWLATLDQLRGQMTAATFDTWLRGTRIVDAAGDTWTVGVLNAYALDWLNKRLMPVITRTVNAVAGREVQIRFVVSGGAPPREEPDEEPLDREDVVLEAVQEERVTVHGDGTSLVWTDFYIKFKLAFRKRALARLKGARLSVFICLALHVDKWGISSPGIERIMQETGYGSRSTVCSALDDLARLRLVEKLPPSQWGTDRYRVLGYAWFGRDPAPALFELDE
jgi:hypothetical protein